MFKLNLEVQALRAEKKALIEKAKNGLY